MYTEEVNKVALGLSAEDDKRSSCLMEYTHLHMATMNWIFIINTTKNYHKYHSNIFKTILASYLWLNIIKMQQKLNVVNL